MAQWSRGVKQYFEDREPYIFIGLSAVESGLEDPDDKSCRTNDVDDTTSDGSQVIVGSQLALYHVGGFHSQTNAPTDPPTNAPTSGECSHKPYVTSIEDGGTNILQDGTKVWVEGFFLGREQIASFI